MKAEISFVPVLMNKAESKAKEGTFEEERPQSQ
jgi:hypothetical protein